MALTPGTRLGPYAVTAAIGSGGMGEVYRATDTRLDRDVAIKTLPSSLAADPEFRSRFEREAKAISQLQHPNICTLHDVGRHDDTDYLVLEYLAGETLAERLNRGALDHDAALTLAIQIAGALDAAHRAGIVHRDLKPGNVMLARGSSASAPPVVKLLDFGLAKPVSPSAGVAPSTVAPTRASPITAQGTVLGTFQYMSPEQLEGREADARSDIWAFGCLLYEMLSSRHAFEGSSQASLISAILRDQPPPVTTHAPVAPLALDHVVSSCLAKDPDERWQSAGDVARELKWIRDAPAAAARPEHKRSTPWAAWLIATIAIAATTGAVAWWAVRPPTPAAVPMLRAELPISVDDAVDDHAVALSPDGRLLAYVTPDRLSLMLSDLETGQTRVLAEGDQYAEPFFSPDGLQVAFVSGAAGTGRTGAWGALRRIAVGGSAPVTVVDDIVSLKGAWWGDDDRIYYTPTPASGLWRVASTGGTPEPLTTPDRAGGEKSHRRPFVLPGSQAVLFVTATSRITSFDEGTIEALSLVDGTRRRLIEGGTSPQYVAAAGALVYEREGTLIAVPFDPDRLTVDGLPATVASGIADEPSTGAARYAISDHGTLVWVPRPTTAGRAAIVAIDREGRASTLADAPYDIYQGRLSPDGNRLATDPDGATQQITVIDLDRKSRQRVTHEWDNGRPVWTADGTALIFHSTAADAVGNLYLRAADGSGGIDRLTTSDEDQTPADVSGRTLVFESRSPTTMTDLWTMSLDDRVPRVLVQTPADEVAARLSPDGQWMAYQSNQSSDWEVIVQAFPAGGEQWQVSPDGGRSPVWLPDGSGFVYLKGLDVMAVSVTTGAGFNWTAPTKLFSIGPDDLLLDVARDGRVLVLEREPASTASSLGIIVNWFETLKQGVN